MARFVVLMLAIWFYASSLVAQPSVGGVFPPPNGAGSGLPGTFTDISTPASPSSGSTKVYTKGGKACAVNSAGVETCTGATGGTGDAASVVTATFSATLTFTCPFATSGTYTVFKLSTTLTADVTSSTLATCTPGQSIVFVLQQDGTGGRTFAWPTGFSQACTVSPIAGAITKAAFAWDGTTAQLLSCASDSGPLLFSSEAAAPGTPPSGSVYCWLDSTDRTGLECKNSSGVIYRMMRLSELSGINPKTSTYQVLAADFSTYQTISVASGTFTITLVASGSQPTNGQYITVLNYGSGVVTIARSGQNINGGTTSLTLPAASATAPTTARIWSDGTNYFAELAGASSGSGAGSVYTTVSFSATPAFTVSTSAIQVFTITLTGAVTSSTLTTTSATNGQDVTFNICQDATGGRTFAWPTNVTGNGTVVGAASTCSRQTFRFDGTNAFAVTPLTCPACSSGVTFTPVTAPGTPASGLYELYVDSTSKNFSGKNDAGLVNHGIQTVTCTNQFARATTDVGGVTCASIAAADIPAAVVGPSKMAASTVDAQSDGATITWAIGSVLNAQASVTLGGNRTLAITNPVIGGTYTFKITQDGTGTRTLALGSGCTWKVRGGGAGAITLTTTAGAIDVLTFMFDGTNCLATIGLNFN